MFLTILAMFMGRLSRAGYGMMERVCIMENFARVQSCHDITIQNFLFAFLSFGLFFYSSLCRFVFLLFCPDITLIKCLKGLKSQKSLFCVQILKWRPRVGIDLPGRLKSKARLGTWIHSASEVSVLRVLSEWSLSKKQTCFCIPVPSKWSLLNQ